jgi:hypothetical protein
MKKALLLCFVVLLGVASTSAQENTSVIHHDLNIDKRMESARHARARLERRYQRKRREAERARELESARARYGQYGVSPSRWAGNNNPTLEPIEVRRCRHEARRQSTYLQRNPGFFNRGSYESAWGRTRWANGRRVPRGLHCW